MKKLSYSDLTDGQLDDMYALAVNNRDNAGKLGAGLEIVKRLASPGAFWGQLNPFADTNFPKYRALVYQATSGMVNAPVASESLKQSATDLARKGVDTAKSIGSGVTIIAASAAIIALLIFLRRK